LRSHPRRPPTAGLKASVPRLQGNSPRTLEDVPTSDLRPWPDNPRTHSRKQIRKLARSISRFGFQSPIVINEDNVVLVGHARLSAAQELGLETVPCLRVTGLPAAEQRAYVIADNRLALESGWDNVLLIDNVDLTDLTGFEPGEIDELFADLTDTDEDPSDDLPALARTTTARLGDLWLLGRHRLLCGDARSGPSLSTVMAGTQAAMVITDPPYNVRVQGHVSGRGKTRHSEFAFASGEMSDRAYRQFLATTLGNMAEVCVGGALIFTFIDWRHVGVLSEVGEGLGLALRNICVWAKAPGQGSLYRSAHELVFVFQKPGGQISNNIQLGRYGRSQTNVWSFPSPNKFASADDPIRGHPTPKPVALVAEAIKDASRRGETVLDAFSGSGTVFLAAEKVGRIACGIEYDPVYVDLSIRRWQAFTGRDAILAGTDLTFDAVATSRGAEP
jgi:DNA modification methylase